MGVIEVITSAALGAGVPPALLLSICFAESSFRNVVVPHDGRSASIGVCQVKRDTARWIAARDNLSPVGPDSLLNIERNVEYAAHYLKYQLHRYPHNQACAIDAYNKGTCVDTHSQYVTRVKRIRKHKIYLKGIRR